MGNTVEDAEIITRMIREWLLAHNLPLVGHMWPFGTLCAALEPQQSVVGAGALICEVVTDYSGLLWPDVTCPKCSMSTVSDNYFLSYVCSPL